MDKKFAFLFAISITLIIAINVSLFSTQLSPQREKAVISRIIDGDTLELKDARRIRLLNINTPEKNIPGSELATKFMKNYENKEIELEITGPDKYNRLLARIYTPEYLNLKLVEEGLAVKFLVDKNEEKIFAKAEKSAINSQLGIWKKSKYYNCLESLIDSKDEIVTLSNNCNNINIGSWIVKDESRKLYRFNSIELGKVILHSAYGEDNGENIFWNSKTDIWNNDKDTLYLFDKDWQIVHVHSYGY